MREGKKKRLEARGWKAGSVGEFLGLTPDEEAYIEVRLRLAEGLRKRRVQRQLTQTGFAKAVRSSQSRVAKMETGDPAVSLDLLIRGLLALGATPGDLAKIITGDRSVPVRYAVGEKRSEYRLDHSKARAKQAKGRAGTRRKRAEDAEDVAVYHARAKERSVKLETALKGMRRRGKL